MRVKPAELSVKTTYWQTDDDDGGDSVADNSARETTTDGMDFLAEVETKN